jgi:hypothetical protein
MLATAAAMATSPVLAEECRIGPPPHQKGPLVWMDMDQVELDAAYDQFLYAPLHREVQNRLASNSNGARARIGQPWREAYGPSRAEVKRVVLTHLILTGNDDADRHHYVDEVKRFYSGPIDLAKDLKQF